MLVHQRVHDAQNMIRFCFAICCYISVLQKTIENAKQQFKGMNDVSDGPKENDIPSGYLTVRHGIDGPFTDGLLGFTY